MVTHNCRSNALPSPQAQFENYPKGPYFQKRAHDLLASGIFNADGPEWKRQRKVAANIFNVKNFRDFVEGVFADEMSILSRTLDRASADGAVLDLHELFFKFTLDGFAKIGFGINLESLSSEVPNPFAEAFDRAQRVVDRRMVSPFWRIEEAVLPVGREMKRDLKTIHDFGLNVVLERRADPEKDSYNDLLSMFMRSKTESGNPPSDRELADVVLNMIIAGRDTTAQALSWTFYMLAQNPEAEAKLVNEIMETLGDNKTPTYEQIRTMRYANAVFHETLRLWPSVPKEIKQALADDVLPDGTQVDAGALIVWVPFAMGRSKHIWGADAKQFKPERWLGEKDLQPSNWDYPVFNGGPRICLGRSMAELEGVYVLVSILRRFKVTVRNVDTVAYDSSLTLPMKTGLMCSFAARF
ncbi:cytochrome P450 [Blyttiomyces helicus]|uniref:Cytochrome P450 n=1 Tax=Blyttiomyces helicus TaxID=388810 RepID=A0A4P9WKC0_9FUNG|nr:cytochrome P450 [Blyttiomyces helicus]|eukprot:RKO93429.1 cytochrome P450 [Blyttiomyces helicus]